MHKQDSAANAVKITLCTCPIGTPVDGTLQYLKDNSQKLMYVFY